MRRHDDRFMPFARAPGRQGLDRPLASKGSIGALARGRASCRLHSDVLFCTFKRGGQAISDPDNSGLASPEASGSASQHVACPAASLRGMPEVGSGHG